MKRFAVFAVLVVIALCAPTSKALTENEIFKITKGFFTEDLKVHTAEHDIVKILYPLNALNYGENDDDDDEDNNDKGLTIFFVEADINNGVKEYKGLSVLKNKQVKKLLETGTDASAANYDTKTAYFAASDGIYVYDQKENAAVKYGSINDNLIGIAKADSTDLIYILTNNHELYKVTDDGTKKVKVDDVVGAEGIVLDNSNNLYYYSTNKQLYVFNGDGVKKIEGLPANPLFTTYIYLQRPPSTFVGGISANIDDKAYIIYANGSSKVSIVQYAVELTAYAESAYLIHYYAFEKKIYRIMGSLDSVRIPPVSSEYQRYDSFERR